MSKSAGLLLRATPQQRAAAREFVDRGWKAARVVRWARLPFEEELVGNGPYLELDWQPDENGPPTLRKVIDRDGEITDGYVNLD